VKVLIDTHTFLWMAAEPEKLPRRAREVCESAELVFSVASVWEIGIKWETGRLPLPGSPRDYIALQIKRGGIAMLPIQYRHALTAAGLPMLHRDPFDRMLAAQCLEEGFKCVTRDSAIAAYGVEVVWE
jgi:PIN domain nuclease of toxin-antitoxin system